MDFHETENVVIRFAFGAVGTAGALWFLWNARFETPFARRDLRTRGRVPPPPLSSSHSAGSVIDLGFRHTRDASRAFAPSATT